MKKDRPLQTASRRGFTVLEILLVVSVLAVMLVLIFPAYGFVKRKAEDGVCMQNLRNLHAGFSAYLQDHAFVWPQNPYLKQQDASDIDNVEAKWFFEQLKDYGPTRETWLCPSERGQWAEVNDPEHFDSSYAPSNFDDTPNIAYRWALQPWLIERGGFHDKGTANAIFPDGHINKKLAPGLFEKLPPSKGGGKSAK